MAAIVWCCECKCLHDDGEHVGLDEVTVVGHLGRDGFGECGFSAFNIRQDLPVDGIARDSLSDY